MAKQTPSSNNRLLFVSLLVSCLIIAGWFIQSEKSANWRDRINQYIDNGEIVTLEARFLPNQLVDNHRQELIGNDKKTLQQTSVHYSPYLLLDVKYTENQRSREGFLLWSLVEGEIVLNTESWESTHGFKDCLECQANRNDFKIIQAVAKYPNGLSIEEMQRELKIEREVFEPWLEETKQKYLIVQKGPLLHLHFENPKILVTPHTKIKYPLVFKPLGEGQKIPRLYSRSQIITLAQAAFGSDFKIRSEQEIFLPIYKLNILNLDGSVQTSQWNALTGQRMIPRYLTKN